MKFQKLSSLIVLAVFTPLLIPTNLAAQDATAQAKKVKFHHYQLIDMGTFGGPVSSNGPFLQAGSLNKRGVTVGWSATAISDTIPPSSFLICGGLDAVVPYITHTFAWQNGAVTDLGSLAGPDYCSEPFWVNDRGEIVGASEIAQIDPVFGIHQSRAVLWKNGQITDLGSLGGYEAAAGGINNRGQIAGISTNTIPDPYCGLGYQIRTFLWEHGQMKDLGTLGGNCAQTGLVDTAGNPINERGQVVGGSTTSSIPNPVTGIPPWDPFLWEEGTGMIDLGTLGGAFGGAQGVNKRSQVIGQSSIAADPGACIGFPDNGNSNCHAFLWDKGTLTDLTTSSIGGSPEWVASLNDAGEIVGEGSFPNAPGEAFLWRNGVATDLGHLGDCGSSAQTINSKSQVVGGTFSCDGNFIHAFLWDNGSMVDLNTLIPPHSSLQLVVASNINERGEINGDGVPPGFSHANWNTQGHEYLLIPCDDDHQNVEGCDYSMVDAAEVSSDASATLAPQSPHLSKEAMARIMSASRNPFVRRYRLSGLRPAPSN